MDQMGEKRPQLPGRQVVYKFLGNISDGRQILRRHSQPKRFGVTPGAARIQTADDLQEQRSA